MSPVDRRKSLHRATHLLARLPPATVSAHTQGDQPPQEVSLSHGDYQFTVDTLEVDTGWPVTLRLTNTDWFTPHNVTLQDTATGVEISANISAGSKAVGKLTPPRPAPIPSSTTENGLSSKAVRDGTWNARCT